MPFKEGFWGMKIAIDISPLTSGNFLQHRVRGTGFYLRSLKESLLKYCPDNEYEFFNRGEKVKLEPDVTHYPYFEPYFLTLPSNINQTNVITVHDLTPFVFKNEFPAGIKGEIKWQIQKRRLERAGAVITDSNSSKKDINKFTGIDNSKIYVVYLAAASHFKQISEEKKKEVAKKFSLPEDFILYVGDVTWNKNLPNLIEAVGKTGSYLVIAGAAFANESFDRTNPWNKDLARSQNLAKQNKRIISTGFVEDNDLVALYNAAKLFVMPSLYEGFGLPVLEAMASGCPVITSGKGSLREVAGNSAYYIDPYNVDSITQGINELMSDGRLRNALSEKGLREAKKFSWKKTAQDTFKVYEKVISNG